MISGQAQALKPGEILIVNDLHYCITNVELVDLRWSRTGTDRAFGRKITAFKANGEVETFIRGWWEEVWRHSEKFQTPEITTEAKLALRAMDAEIA